MLRRVILGTILGALAAFAWAYVSWSAVRLYDWAVQPLPAANELAPQIARAVPRDGAYAFPALDMDAVRAHLSAEWIEEHTGEVEVMNIRQMEIVK